MMEGGRGCRALSLQESAATCPPGPEPLGLTPTCGPIGLSLRIPPSCGQDCPEKEASGHFVTLLGKQEAQSK